MTFDKFNRRAHLYLGLFLMPWLLMYGVSSFIVIHQSWFRTDKRLEWEPVFQKKYDRAIDPKADLRSTAEQILKDCELEGAFWANKPNADTINIDRFSFWESIRLKYSIKDQTLKAERQKMRMPQSIMRMHFRGGYLQPGFWDKFWGVAVDVACVGILIWVFSGLLMWWRLPRLRTWGAIAVAAGFISFLALAWTL